MFEEKLQKFTNVNQLITAEQHELDQIIKRETKEIQLKEIDEWEYYFKSYQKDLVKLKYN